MRYLKKPKTLARTIMAARIIADENILLCLEKMKFLVLFINLSIVVFISCIYRLTGGLFWCLMVLYGVFW